MKKVAGYTRRNIDDELGELGRIAGALLHFSNGLVGNICPSIRLTPARSPGDASPTIFTSEFKG
jgi:hypothetical protein